MTDQFSIDKLFRVSCEREFSVRGKTVKLWVRTLGAANNAARNDYATTRTRALLSKIRREGTPEHERIMLAPHDEHREELTARALLLSLRRFAVEASREVVPNDTAEPGDNPTITEVIESIDAEETAKVEAVKEIDGLAKSRLKQFEEELRAMDDIELVEKVVELTVDNALSAEFNHASDVATLYYSVFSDEKMKQRFFSSTEEVDEADNDFINQLLTCYAELDVYAVRPDELKN
jgi:hypothetical protein